MGKLCSNGARSLLNLERRGLCRCRVALVWPVVQHPPDSVLIFAVWMSTKKPGAVFPDLLHGGFCVGRCVDYDAEPIVQLEVDTWGCVRGGPPSTSKYLVVVFTVVIAAFHIRDLVQRMNIYAM